MPAGFGLQQVPVESFGYFAGGSQILVRRPKQTFGGPHGSVTAIVVTIAVVCWSIFNTAVVAVGVGRSQWRRHDLSMSMRALEWHRLHYRIAVSRLWYRFRTDEKRKSDERKK